MSAKPILFATFAGLLAAAVHAQPPAASPYAPSMPAPADGSASALLSNGFTPLAGPADTRWRTDGGPLPVGRDGPIGQELYSMIGLTLANGNGVFGQHLDGGFMIEGGLRTLFFNPEQTAAWTAKVGLTLQTNGGPGDTPTFDHFGLQVRIRDYFRFSGVFALGRDWFLYGASPIGDGTGTLRAGIDLGVRWGAQKVTFDVIDDPDEGTDYRFRTDNYGGVVLGWHTMLEVPMGAWVLFGGLRAEYGYNWSELLPGQNSNTHDVNLLFTTGFRY